MCIFPKLVFQEPQVFIIALHNKPNLVQITTYKDACLDRAKVSCTKRVTDRFILSFLALMVHTNKIVLITSEFLLTNKSPV